MTPRSRTALAAVSSVNLVVNLLFPVLAVRALGAGSASDALFMAFILPGVVMVLLGNSVLNWSTPRLVRRADPAARRALAWSLLWVIVAGVGALCLSLWLVALLVQPRLAADGSYALALGVLPFALLAMLASAVMALAQSLYTAERDVLGGEARTLGANLLAIGAWLWVSPQTLAACAALFLLRPLLVATVLLPRLGRPRALVAQDGDLRDVLRESRLLLLAAFYYKSEPLLDRLLFASVGGGSVAAYHLAQQMVVVVTTLMQRTIAAPLVAPLAERIHAGDAPGAHRLLGGATRRVLGVGAGMWLLFLVAGEPLVRLLFGGGAPDAGYVTLTAHMLVGLGGLMIGMLLGLVWGQAYYCSGETGKMLRRGVTGYTVGIGLKVTGLLLFGLPGLVLAISVAWLANALLLRAGLTKMLDAAGRKAAASMDPVVPGSITSGTGPR